MYCLVWQRFWPLKWRLAHLSPGSRWAPVLELYIEYCSARLDGIGGDSSQVPASLTWKPLLPREGRDGLPDFALLLAAGHSLRNARAGPCRI